MRIANRLFLLILPGCFCLCVAQASAQSGRVKDSASDKPESHSAQRLYEDARTYASRKFEEFKQKNVPYDAKLAMTIEGQQRELATRDAGLLESRTALTGEDFYYLGMLHHLGGNGDGALAAMRRFLTGNPVGEKAQLARAVIVLYAVKKNLLPEAETMSVAYLENQPQDPLEHYGIESLLADAYFKMKNYERMAIHAREMFAAAKIVAGAGRVDVFKRDDMLLKSATLVAEALARQNQPERAGRAFQELRKVAISLPSGNLYKMANIRLATVDPNADYGLIFGETTDMGSRTPPEIAASQWIDQAPATLEKLRGKVVLLDFWAPWCEPCRYTLPKLQKWHEAYKDKGLVILGITNYYGQADGKKLTQAEELDYLRDFKKKNRLPYGFVVADSSDNAINYGVFSIPMSFLIDRRGKVRFIAAGAGEAEITRLGKMIKKLLDEPASPPGLSADQGKK
jgi:thiol-disulfide isomerase/thioredoxin